MSGPEERKRAVELYLTTSTTTTEAVEHLSHPTRRRLERRPAEDPRYVGHMAKPIIPLETRRKAIEPVSGGMRGSKPTGGSVRARRDDSSGDDGDVCILSNRGGRLGLVTFCWTRH